MERHIGRTPWRGLLAGWLLVAGLITTAEAGTTGKLSGRVLDKKKQPLIGVNVVIPSIHAGGATDADGRYAVLNIPAGTYEVKISLLGYRATAVQNVQVSADQTTSLDVTLEEAPVQMEEVVVSAKRPVVDLKLTSNLAAVHREEIKKLPVQELQDIVNLQAGVVDGHIRGGRLGEVQYQVDGVTVNNPYDNTSSLKLDRSLLEEVQVVSGTFDAEYGQAMSGVVNAVLRRGSEKFRWDAEVFDGAFVFKGSPNPLILSNGGLGVNTGVVGNGDRPLPFDFHPSGIQNYQMGVSGPTGVPKTYFLLNARSYKFRDYVDATRLFTPWIRHDPDSLRRLPDPLYKLVNPDGDGKEVPLGWSQEWSGVAKLTNHSFEQVELSYQAILNSVNRQPTDFAFRYDPDGLATQRTRSVVHGVDLTHTLSKTTFYNLSVRQNWFDYHDVKYENLFDPRYDSAGPPQTYGPYTLGGWVQGVSIGRTVQNTNTVVVKGSFVNQRTKEYQVKFGGELQWPHVRFGSPGTLGVPSQADPESLRRNVQTPFTVLGQREYRPYMAAAFAQNELEWNDLKIRAGLRFEYLNPRSGLPSDLANPANSIPDQPRSHYQPASRKITVSPRIGVSYPVTNKAALFFAYGHFYQLPELGKIFDLADYSILRDLQAGTANYSAVMGNPDIRPEKTVQYQFGYKQSITDDFGVDLTLFYKDIRDLLGVEFITTYNGAEYSRYTNVDFGGVEGFTLAVNHRHLGPLGVSVDYTWQLAQGNNSDPRETATRASAGADPNPRSVPFDWDQRHTLNLTATMTRPNDFNLSTIVRIASGQPFTPALSTGFGNGLETNSGRKPGSVVVDLRTEKGVHAAWMPISVFARVFNVFDAKYNHGPVYDTSGSPYYSRFPARDQNDLANPTRLYAPRRIELGLSLRAGEE